MEKVKTGWRNAAAWVSAHPKSAMVIAIAVVVIGVILL